MAALTTQTVAWPSGLASATYNTCASGGDNVEAPTYGGQIVLHFKNTNAASRVVTIDVPGTVAYGDNTPNPTVTVNATNGDVFVPLHPAYADSTGRVQLTYSVNPPTNLTVAILKMSQNA